MFVYNVTINDVVYKTEQNNQTFKIDESLDSAVLVIPFTTRQEAFNRFDNVIISSSDGETTRTTHWLIWADQISIATNYPIRYQHTLALIETTKILDKYACGSLTDTQPLNAPQRTIYDVLERIRLLSPFVPYQYIYETRAFEIDETLKTYIQTVKAPQFYLDKKNLREAVIEVFKYINAIPRLRYEYEKNYGIYVYRLYADFVNQRKLNITPSNENITTKRLTDFTDEVNGEHYATQVETYLENIVPSEDGIANIYSASKTEYVSFRSNEIVVGQSNIKIILPEKIENLVNIKLITTLVGESNITEIDMLPFCVEKNIYDTLEINGGVGSRRYSFYWSKGSNELDGFNYTNDVLFPTMALTNILNYVNSSVSIWKAVLFKIEYIPRIENMRSEIYREDYNYLKESEIQLNQGERINSLFDVTNNIYGQIQRIGVDTLSVSKIHKTLHAYDSTHLNGIWSLGDYTSDGYFITTVELIYYSYYVVARYEMSMNWNRISQFIQIDKEFRPYEIALTKSDYTLKRELAMPFAFIEISNTQRMNQESLEKYQTLITPFMRTLKSAATYELPITNAFLDVNGGVGTIVPLTIMAEKNTLKWRFGFDSTILSGNRVIRKTAFLSEVYEQKQVKYAKNDGTLQFASISLFNGLWQYINSTSDMLIGMNNASKDLPYADINKNVLGTIESYEASIYENFDSFPLPQQIGALVVALDENAIYRYTEFNGYFIVDNIVAYKKDFVFDLPTYMILKDKSEILGFNLSIPILPYKTEFNRFIIGDMLSKDNGLIKARQSGKSIYLRSTNSFFDKSNTKKFFDANDQYLIPANLITANYVDVSLIPFNYDNFAITDLNDNLYLAVNQRNLDGTKTIINKIYFNFVDRRTQADVIA